MKLSDKIQKKFDFIDSLVVDASLKLELKKAVLQQAIARNENIVVEG